MRPLLLAGVAPTRHRAWFLAPALLGVLAVASCSSRRIPDHLQLDDPAGNTHDPTADLQTTEEVLASIIHTDPLARTPKLPSPEHLPIGGDMESVHAYIAAVKTVERGDAEVSQAFQQLEDQWRGTAAVALSRGYRLKVAETRIASSREDPEDAEREVAVLITGLIPGDTDENSPPPRRPLDWLESEGPLDKAALAYGDRWVLGAWLDSPDIPLSPVSTALDGPAFDRLRSAPLGRLLQSRTSGAPADALDAGYADLHRATLLALTRAAADRDSEQASWAELQRSAAEELEADDPIDHLLVRATDALITAAAVEEAVGGALVAIHARRWLGKCDRAPCEGVDRVEAIRAGIRWGDRPTPYVNLWTVIALKDAVDTMDVGHDTVLFPKAMMDLTDALMGTGAGPLPADLLRYRKADEHVWLTLGRAVGSDATTDWEQVRAALGAHLQREARAALDTAPEETHELLDRIARRAPG